MNFQPNSNDASNPLANKANGQNTHSSPADKTGSNEPVHPPVSSENGELDDETIAAGDEHTLETTGGTHASLMSLENPEQILHQLRVRNHCLS